MFRTGGDNSRSCDSNRIAPPRQWLRTAVCGRPRLRMEHYARRLDRNMASRSDIVGGAFRAWGGILAGYRPTLSVEITRECPLRCPGCYAYGDAHLGGAVTLRALSDHRGDELVQRFMRLVDEHKPLHVSIVGGEPLVRYRELNVILPKLASRNIHTQLVTSAVRPIPLPWADLHRLQIVVSIDGLPPEHDARRTPATYDRILKHIDGHQVTVHCTVTPSRCNATATSRSFCDSGKRTRAHG